jgi:Fe-S-cluster containining protein
MRLPVPPNSPSYLERLENIFAAMDSAYDQAAAAYGFRCTGCEDNCCMTRFTHHTLLEYLSLHHGVAALSEEIRQSVRARAEEVCRRTAAAERQGDRLREMCPLNLEGLCIVYPHRPMICRMHGIPNTLHRPDGQVVTGPGCDEFSARCAKKSAVVFDRTPFYRRVAELEGELRRRTGFTAKIRMSVAQMVVEVCGSLPPGRQPPNETERRGK